MNINLKQTLIMYIIVASFLVYVNIIDGAQAKMHMSSSEALLTVHGTNDKSKGCIDDDQAAYCIQNDQSVVSLQEQSATLRPIATTAGKNDDLSKHVLANEAAWGVISKLPLIANF